MARDINRIKPNAERLAAVWEHKAPDMRMAQFMMNILGEYYAATKHDCFYVEDEEFLDFLEHKLWEKTS